jgi:aldose 1-epimerase
MTAPSGEQHELRLGEQYAVVVEVGGGIRAYRVGDREVLDGYGEDQASDGARGQTLIPWPNRVQDGRWTWRGESMQLTLTEPEQHNAIHGLLRWAPWSLLERDDASAVLTCTSHPQPGYPWRLDAHNAWSLTESGITVQTTIVNRSDTAAPVAAGFHPYMHPGTSLIDDTVLTLPADTRILTGAQQIPVGREPVDGTPYDFRAPRRLGDLAIDHAFTDLHRGPDGRARVTLGSPRDGWDTVFWVDEAYPYIEAFTGDALPDPARRRQGVAFEPMSVAPNAMAADIESMAVLEPGGSWVGNWGIDPF